MALNIFVTNIYLVSRSLKYHPCYPLLVISLKNNNSVMYNSYKDIYISYPMELVIRDSFIVYVNFKSIYD